jgi:hypothetical protein
MFYHGCGARRAEEVAQLDAAVAVELAGDGLQHTTNTRQAQCELSLRWEQSTRVRKGYGQELPARVLQKCLLTLFRLPPSPLLP